MRLLKSFLLSPPTKEEGRGGSENSGKNLLSQMRYIFVDDALNTSAKKTSTSAKH